jgi:hypothetical protein
VPLEEGSGLNRNAPFPASAVIPVPKWEVQVLDVLKADQAWQALQSADELNLLPQLEMNICCSISRQKYFIRERRL